MAGRKILALLTVVRIHLREYKRGNAVKCCPVCCFEIDTNHTDREVSIGSSASRAKAEAVGEKVGF